MRHVDAHLHVRRGETRRHKTRQGAAENLSHHGLGHAKQPEPAATDAEGGRTKSVELWCLQGHSRSHVVVLHRVHDRPLEVQL